MEEGRGSYVLLSEPQSQRRRSRSPIVCFTAIVGVVLIIAVISGSKVVKIRQAEEAQKQVEAWNDVLVSRGPALGVSEKSVMVSVKPHPWKYEALQWQRTGFHFQPQKNWMNDPNGPLVYKGWYHFFYQYNPDSAVWGNITWGHAVSKDLINWQHLDLAMVPDEWYDSNGVWTGSATFLQDDSLLMLYTGSTNASVQVQNLAIPADPDDVLLRKWVKSPANPVLTPPSGIGAKDFRDPTTGWIGSDGSWRIAIGSKRGTTGIVLVYKTLDFLNYELEGTMHAVPGTGMWECVDFYPVEESGSQVGLDTSANGQGLKHVLKASMDDTRNDHYAIGTYYPQNNTFVPDDPSVDVGIGLRYDYGKFYASKTFHDPVKKRRVLWAWVTETDSTQADLLKGWASVQTVPRAVWYDSKTKSNLIQWPVEEVKSLRTENVSLHDIALSPGSVIPINITDASQLDVELTVEFPDKDLIKSLDSEDAIYNCSSIGGAAKRGTLGPFGVLVLADDKLTEQTALYFYISKNQNGKPVTFFCHDESRSSLASDLALGIYGSSVPIVDDENILTVRTLVDHSIVESYAEGGRMCITSRIYPTLAIGSSVRVFLFNNATTAITLHSATFWRMQSASFHR